MKINPKCKCRSLEIIRPILAVPKRSPPVEVILPPSPRFRDRLSRRQRCRPTRSQILRERGVLAYMTTRGILLPQNFRFSLKPLPKVPPVTPKSEFQFECKFEELPKKFPDLTNLQIPVIRDTGVKLSIETLGRYFKCTDYQFNFLHYWFLDVMVDCIWRSQDDFGFSEEEQKIVLSWVLFFFDLIRDSRNYSREEFFGIFRESIDIAVELIEEGDWNMYHPLKIMEINRADKSSQSDVISTRYNTPSALVTPSTMKSKDSECDQKTCVASNDVESSCNESCFCFEKICRFNLEKSSDGDDQSRFVPSQLPSKTKVEDKSSSESFTSSIHGESVADYDYLNYLNYCDPDPENLEDMFSDLHFSDEFRRKCKMIPLSYGKDIPAFILFSPSGAAQSSEDSSQPSTLKKSSNTTTESSSLHPVKSDDPKAIMQKLTMYKVMEQRVRDYLDSNVGLSSWQISTVEEEEENNYYKYREGQYGEGEEEEISVIHSKELEIMKDKQFVSFGMLWMVIDFIYEYFKDNFQYTLIKMALTVEPNLIVQNFNDEWLTPKHLTEDLTLYVKDLKDKYKKIYKKHKKKKEKKDKKKKKDKKSKDKKSKKSDKKKKEKKEKKPKKKGLTEEEKLEKQRLAELEAERIKREIHNKFMFPLQDAIEDDEFFREKFPKWKKVNWRKGKGGKKK